MKFTSALVTILFALAAQGQRMTWDIWEEESMTNTGLLPKYGGVERTAEQKDSDEKFVNSIMSTEEYKSGDKRAASDHLISLGFTYLYRGDLRTAMYRFNQAYLLDSNNTDIYWGYGAVYFSLGRLDLCKEQYMEGLAIEPSNTHLLTDLATYFMQQYAIMFNTPTNVVKDAKEQAMRSLDSAMAYFHKSYAIDPKDQNTTFKLSTAYYYAGDCQNAWRYYEECKALGGRPITEAYTKDLKKKCRRNRKN